MKATIKKLNKNKKDAKEKSRLKAAYYKKLWENSPVACHILNTKGIITNVNQTEARMLGYKKEEMIGKSIFSFILPEQRSEARKRFRQKLAGERLP